MNGTQLTSNRDYSYKSNNRNSKFTIFIRRFQRRQKKELWPSKEKERFGEYADSVLDIKGLMMGVAVIIIEHVIPKLTHMFVSQD